jgi:hypothetical protein
MIELSYYSILKKMNRYSKIAIHRKNFFLAPNLIITIKSVIIGEIKTKSIKILIEQHCSHASDTVV